MIPPSNLWRIPRADALPRSAEAARYARSEFGTDSMAWMLPTRATSPSPWAGLRKWFASLSRPLRAGHVSTPAHHAAFQAGLVTVQLEGEPSHAHLDPTHRHSHSLWEDRPAGALLLPALEADEKPEACECHP